ncbi:hypothetical protein [Streptomyces sp. N35]|uniref:hypothetical protein n=1 Tax=Streptomyces sp. N35 TaxID=2795730 RepID=UPI0018F45E4C|nr:hypothetical protein [Streptomyces sp. N35]
MPSAALEAAVDRVRVVFAGASSPGEVGCSLCHPPEWTALLRAPDVPMPVEAVDLYAGEASDHFDDFEASLRRLLPELTRQLASGVSGTPGGYGGVQIVGYVDWGKRPDHEREAVLGFFEAWWLDTLRSPRPLYSVDDVFQTCVTATRTLTPYLEAWSAQEPGGTADAHLREFVDHHHLDLVNEDDHMIRWRVGFDRPEPMAEIVSWVREHVIERIRTQDTDTDTDTDADPDLLDRLELLRLPVEERWGIYEARFLA